MDSPVHNYCDRWCERCPITAKCAVYAKVENLIDEQCDPDNNAFWEFLRKSLEEAVALLQEAMEKWEFSNDGLQDEGFEERERMKDEKVRNGEMHRLCKEYNALIQDFFSDYLEERIKNIALATIRLDLYSKKELSKISTLKDCYEVLQWYRYLIEAKLFRAMSDLFDAEEEPDEILIYDSNGSAKVALIGIDRSIAAWKELYDIFPEKEDEILRFMIMLQNIRTLTVGFFPDAEKFVRPGFDD